MIYLQNIQKYFEKMNPNTKPASSTNIMLYCNFYSFYSQKVLMALHEKNLSFEPYVVDVTKGEQYSSWFLDINPRGEIPVLQYEKQTIPDSVRILDYLEDFLNPEIPLVNVSFDPKTLKTITRFREMIESLPAGVITVGSFVHPHLCGRPKMPFIYPVRELLKSGDLSSAQNLRRLAEENPKAKNILTYKAEIHDRKHEILTNEMEYLKVLNFVDLALEEVEEQLKSQPEDHWLCCEQFTIADINVAVLLQRLWELGFEKRFWANGKRPFVEKYYSRVSQRDSFKKTIPNLLYHILMIINSQPPAYVAVAGVASVGILISFFYVAKKIVKIVL